MTTHRSTFAAPSDVADMAGIRLWLCRKSGRRHSIPISPKSQTNHRHSAHSLYLALVLAGSSLAGPRLRLAPPAVPAAATFSPTFLKNCDDFVKSLRTSLRCFSPFLGFSKLPVLTRPFRLASARSRSTWGRVRDGVSGQGRGWG